MEKSILFHHTMLARMTHLFFLVEFETHVQQGSYHAWDCVIETVNSNIREPFLEHCQILQLIGVGTVC